MNNLLGIGLTLAAIALAVAGINVDSQLRPVWLVLSLFVAHSGVATFFQIRPYGFARMMPDCLEIGTTLFLAYKAWGNTATLPITYCVTCFYSIRHILWNTEGSGFKPHRLLSQWRQRSTVERHCASIAFVRGTFSLTVGLVALAGIFTLAPKAFAGVHAILLAVYVGVLIYYDVYRNWWKLRFPAA